MYWWIILSILAAIHCSNFTLERVSENLEYAVLSLSTAFMLGHVQDGDIFESDHVETFIASVSDSLDATDFQSLLSFCIERTIGREQKVTKAVVLQCFELDESSPNIMMEIADRIRLAIISGNRNAIEATEQEKIIYTQYLLLVNPELIQAYEFLLMAPVNVVYSNSLHRFSDFEFDSLVISIKNSGFYRASSLDDYSFQCRSFIFDLDFKDPEDLLALKIFSNIRNKTFLIPSKMMHGFRKVIKSLDGSFVINNSEMSNAVDILDEIYQNFSREDVYLFDGIDYPTFEISGVSKKSSEITLFVSPNFWKQNELKSLFAGIFLRNIFRPADDSWIYDDSSNVSLSFEEQLLIINCLVGLSDRIQNALIWSDQENVPAKKIFSYQINKSFENLKDKNQASFEKFSQNPIDCIRVTLRLKDDSFTILELFEALNEKVQRAGEKLLSSLTSGEAISHEERVLASLYYLSLEKRDYLFFADFYYKRPSDLAVFTKVFQHLVLPDTYEIDLLGSDWLMLDLGSIEPLPTKALILRLDPWNDCIEKIQNAKLYFLSSKIKAERIAVSFEYDCSENVSFLSDCQSSGFLTVNEIEFQSIPSIEVLDIISKQFYQSLDTIQFNFELQSFEVTELKGSLVSALVALENVRFVRLDNEDILEAIVAALPLDRQIFFELPANLIHSPLLQPIGSIHSHFLLNSYNVLEADSIFVSFGNPPEAAPVKAIVSQDLEINEFMW